MEAALTPVELLKADYAIRAASAHSQTLQQVITTPSVAMHDSTIPVTPTPEISELLSRVIALEASLAHQTHLNEVHEAHTAKNFREQRHINKDRKFRLQQTMEAVEDGMNDQSDETRKLEVRANSHALQLKEMKKRVERCASGGEYLEEICEGLQMEVEELKVEKRELQERVKELEEEVMVVKERAGVLEGRVKVLERLMKGEMQFGPGCINIEKVLVLSVPKFAVGNYCLFPGFY
ncbi:hypothetical protein D6D01_07795 [Aureobasidium pullulans]|uniref:Uncharacterized protein n=1 Tax=Aureobasidium pullulans TaxID=5580 RepID=A0A4S9KKS1_AURPU|nr:hypothetical protein D6D01_07795 [Aureobasidium pullulans]